MADKLGDSFIDFLSDTAKLSSLKEICFSCNLEKETSRWNTWRLFLKIIPVADENEIKRAITKDREFYYSKCMQFLPRSKLGIIKEVEDPLNRKANVIFTVRVIN